MLTHSPSAQVPQRAKPSDKQNASYLQQVGVDVWVIDHVLHVYAPLVYQHYVDYRRHTHLVERTAHESVMVSVGIVHNVHLALRLVNNQFHLSVEHDNEAQVHLLYLLW